MPLPLLFEDSLSRGEQVEICILTMALSSLEPVHEHNDLRKLYLLDARMAEV
jgi:hypothetical protein